MAALDRRVEVSRRALIREAPLTMVAAAALDHFRRPAQDRTVDNRLRTQTVARSLVMDRGDRVRTPRQDQELATKEAS